MFLARLLGKASPSKATKKLRLPALIALGEVRKTRQYTRENITSVKLPNVWDTIRNIPFMLLLRPSTTGDFEPRNEPERPYNSVIEKNLETRKEKLFCNVQAMACQAEVKES